MRRNKRKHNEPQMDTNTKTRAKIKLKGNFESMSRLGKVQSNISNLKRRQKSIDIINNDPRLRSLFSNIPDDLQAEFLDALNRHAGRLS